MTPAPPAETAIQLFPKWLVIALGGAGFAFTIGLLVWTLMSPERFDAGLSRAVLSIGFSFVAGLFLFILYPWHYRLVKLPYVDVTLELVGPTALFIGLVVFLQYIIPKPADWLVYDLRTEDRQQLPAGMELREVTLTFDDGLDSHEYQLVVKPGAPLLDGVRVHFPENKTKRTGSIHFSKFVKDQKVEFKRYGDRVVTVKLEGK